MVLIVKIFQEILINSLLKKAFLISCRELNDLTEIAGIHAVVAAILPSI